MAPNKKRHRHPWVMGTVPLHFQSQKSQVTRQQPGSYHITALSGSIPGFCKERASCLRNAADQRIPAGPLHASGVSIASNHISWRSSFHPGKQFLLSLFNCRTIIAYQRRKQGKQQRSPRSSSWRARGKLLIPDVPMRQILLSLTGGIEKPLYGFAALSGAYFSGTTSMPSRYRRSISKAWCAES